MKLDFVLKLDFDEHNNLYYDLLKNEDFDFKTKDIKIDIKQESSNSPIEISFSVDSVINSKIASTAVLRSIEIISKSLEI